MRRKVAWVFIGINLALWLGGCDSEKRAYRINEEQTPLFGEGAPVQVESPAGSATPLASLNGFDRSHWDTYHYLPPRGLVPHHPTLVTRGFFGDEPLHTDRPSPLRLDGDIEASAALANGGYREPMGVRRFYTVPLEAADLGWDLVSLPVKAAVVEPRPWDVVYSPDEESVK